MSDFKSPFERDMFHAERLGAKAAEFEIKQPGNPTFSDWVRDDFRKGILSRYRPSQDDGERERERLADQRRQLNANYYAQAEILRMINAKPKVEIPTFDDPTGEIIDTSFEVETPEDSATAELLSVMADGMHSQALVA